MQLSSFKTYVKYDWKRTDKDTELVQAYNDMIDWVAAQIPNSNYKFQSYLTTSIGQEDYPLPSNMLNLYHPIRLLLGAASSDTGYPLDQVTKERYDIIEPNPNRSSPTKGQPSSYTIFSRSILLTPIPDLATYILEINWGKNPTELSADSDTPSLGGEWDPVLKQGTLERLFQGIGLLEEANYWASQYKDVNPGPGYGLPVGYCKKLLDNEKDIEGYSIGQVRFNSL